MANLLKTLINHKQSSIRFITTLNLTPQLFSNPKSILNQEITTNPSFNNDFRSKNDKKGDEIETHLSKLQIYPSFSFGHFLNPNLSSGFGLDQVDMGMPVLDEVEEPGMMWADSVKKKRKKKMNKHKFKKQRKRLRRKTRKT